MKTIERFLNFLIWAIHDIGYAFKHNALFEAWRKMEKETPNFGVLKAPQNTRHVPALPSAATLIELDGYDRQKEQSEINSKLTNKLLYKSEVFKTKNLTGFKEHVRRENIIKFNLKTYRIDFYSCYAPMVMDRSLQCKVTACEQNQDKWWGLLGGTLSAFF
jgi:hypothetical protein